MHASTITHNASDTIILVTTLLYGVSGNFFNLFNKNGLHFVYFLQSSKELVIPNSYISNLVKNLKTILSKCEKCSPFTS